MQTSLVTRPSVPSAPAPVVPEFPHLRISDSRNWADELISRAVVFVTSECGGQELASHGSSLTHWPDVDYSSSRWIATSWKKATEPVTVRFKGTKPGEFPCLLRHKDSKAIIFAHNETEGTILLTTKTYGQGSHWKPGFVFVSSTCRWEYCGGYERVTEDLEITFDPKTVAQISDGSNVRVVSSVINPDVLIAGGHNPQKLTEDQVGVKDGWRTLTLEEVKARRDAKSTVDIQCLVHSFDTASWSKGSASGCVGDELNLTYRTKKPAGFYLPKPKIAEGHNPLDLTEDEVGVKDGWRLLTLGERKHVLNCDDVGKPIASGQLDSEDDSGRWVGQCSGVDPISLRTVYRTKQPAGYYLPKKPERPADVLVKSPWAGETELARLTVTNCSDGPHDHEVEVDIPEHSDGVFSGEWIVAISKAVVEMQQKLRKYEADLKAHEDAMEATA